MDYADPSMNKLAESLAATNVLSDKYRRFIESWALQAISEGYERGLAEGRKRGDKAALPEDAIVTAQLAHRKVYEVAEGTKPEQVATLLDDALKALRTLIQWNGSRL